MIVDFILFFRLFELIQRNILESDVVVPLRSLLRERSRLKTNYASIYREILFFILVILNREQIDLGLNFNPYFEHSKISYFKAFSFDSL